VSDENWQYRLTYPMDPAPYRMDHTSESKVNLEGECGETIWGEFGERKRVVSEKKKGTNGQRPKESIKKNTTLPLLREESELRARIEKKKSSGRRKLMEKSPFKLRTAQGDRKTTTAQGK